MDNKSLKILRIITGRELAYQKAVALSVQSLTEDERNWIRQVLSGNSNSDDTLTEDELNWVKQVLVDQYDYDYDAITKLSPSYLRLKKNQYEQWANKGIVRKELDALREKMKKFTPQELLELRNKNERKSRVIENFAGIYIIHNRVKDIYYVGQSKRIFDRAYKHFITNPAENRARYEWTAEFNLPEIYDDYRLGDKFNISLIPLENTSFSDLNKLERFAISAYNASVEYGGYNRNHGNVMGKPFFKNDDYQKVAELLLDTIKETEIFSTLTDRDKRIYYIKKLFSELSLQDNRHFVSNFADMIKEYKKANKKK